jgi:hypothetical protein
MTLRVLLITVLIGAAAVAPANAQTNDNPFGIGTTLSDFAGGTADADGATPAAGLELVGKSYPPWRSRARRSGLLQATQATSSAS